MPDHHNSDKSEICKLKKLLNQLIKHIDITNLSASELHEIIEMQDDPNLDSVIQNDSKESACRDDVHISKEDSGSLSLPFKLDLLKNKTHIVINEQLKMQKALKKSEQRFKESERKYRDIFENINAYIYIHDFEGNYIETNAHFIKNTGYSKNELQSMNIKDFIPQFYDSETDEYIRRTIANGHDTGLMNLVTKNGRTRVVEYTSSLIQSKDGPKAIRGMARDITEEFRARNALEKSEEKLQIAHDNLEKQVRERTRKLKESNITLRIFLNKKDEAKKEVEEKMLVNIKELILPLVDKMKLSRLDQSQKAYLELIELNLNQTISPFAVSLDSKYYKLSSMELQIANLIKEGNTSSQIASMFNISKGTINTYRDRIRIKLGIKNKNVTLRSYLMTLQK